jgi:hypothetical protein
MKTFDYVRPATIAGTPRLQPLTKFADLDTRRWLDGVPILAQLNRLKVQHLTMEFTAAGVLMQSELLLISRA